MLFVCVSMLFSPSHNQYDLGIRPMTSLYSVWTLGVVNAENWVG